MTLIQATALDGSMPSGTVAARPTTPVRAMRSRLGISAASRVVRPAKVSTGHPDAPSVIKTTYFTRILRPATLDTEPTRAPPGYPSGAPRTVVRSGARRQRAPLYPGIMLHLARTARSPSGHHVREAPPAGETPVNTFDRRDHRSRARRGWERTHAGGGLRRGPGTPRSALRGRDRPRHRPPCLGGPVGGVAIPAATPQEPPWRSKQREVERSLQ